MSDQGALLAATDPGSLNELFNRDPLKLTEIDLQRIVEYYRQERNAWIVEEVAVKTKGKSAKAPATAKAAKATFSLEDLGDLTL